MLGELLYVLRRHIHRIAQRQRQQEQLFSTRQRGHGYLWSPIRVEVRPSRRH